MNVTFDGADLSLGNWVYVKPALGTTQPMLGLGLGLAEALALGLVDGLGEGELVVDPAPGSGSVLMFAVDDWSNATFWLPPKNAAMSGVRREK